MSSELCGKIDISTWTNKANIATPDFKKTDSFISDSPIKGSINQNCEYGKDLIVVAENKITDSIAGKSLSLRFESEYA